MFCPLRVDATFSGAGFDGDIGDSRRSGHHGDMDHSAGAASLCRKASPGAGSTWKEDHCWCCNTFVQDFAQRKRPCRGGLCNNCEPHGHGSPERGWMISCFYFPSFVDRVVLKRCKKGNFPNLHLGSSWEVDWDPFSLEVPAIFWGAFCT